MTARTGIAKNGCTFGLTSLVLLLLGCVGASAAKITVVNETFDPPFLVPLLARFRAPMA